MFDQLLRAALVVGGVSVGCAWTWPGAFPDGDPVAVLVRLNMPIFYRAVVAWYYVAPGVAAFLALHVLITTSRIWFARISVSMGLRSRLPTWPLSPQADGPAIVVGEVHHPTRAEESPAPEWLTIPERGLFTGVAIFGAVGSGKTSACMHPFARQLLSWQADNPERRVAALVLEVKGMSVTTFAASWPMCGVKSWTMDGDGQGTPDLTTPTKADPEIRHCSRSVRRLAARRRAC